MSSFIVTQQLTMKLLLVFTSVHSKAAPSSCSNTHLKTSSHISAGRTFLGLGLGSNGTRINEPARLA